MIGSKLRHLRFTKGMTLDDLAKCSSVSRGNIHRIELDQISPRLETLRDLCEALDTNLSAFFQSEAAAQEEAEAGPQARAKGFRGGTLAWLEHAEALIRYSADSLTVLDHRGFVVYESDPALRFHAASPEERRTQPWWGTAHPDERPALEASFEAFLASGEASSPLQYRAAHRDGTWHWVRTRLSRQVDHPLIQGIIASTQDVTLLKAIEESAQNRRKYESLATALGGVTHTFSNLLMGIQATNETVIKKGALDPFSRSHLGKVQTAIAKASSLLRQMRDFAGNPLLFVEPLDVNKVIRDLGPTLEGLLQQGHLLCYELDDRSPCLEADRKLLEQILIALVSNADDALEASAGIVTLRTARGLPGATGEGTWVEPLQGDHAACLVLTIQDTGSGMEPEVLRKICDPFFTTRFQGRGMGLASVLGIVRAHQGGLRVVSTIGQGSRFEVFLPACEGRAAEPAPSAPVEVRRTVLPKGILVAEDDAFLRDSISAMLGTLGYDRVFEAADGQEAIQQYQAHTREIGLVLLDVDMPSLGGIETYAKLREMNPALKIVFATGAWEQNPELVRHTAHGITGILSKPFQQDELSALLDFYLR